MKNSLVSIIAKAVSENVNQEDGRTKVTVTMEAANDTSTAFFKAYTKVSPKIKKAKSKEHLTLIEEATSAMNKLSKALGARSDGKKGGFSNIKHAPKKERTKE